MSNDLGKLKYENAVLRQTLAKIGGFANSWAAQLEPHEPINGSLAGNWLNTIEQTCKAALDEKKPPKAPLTYVEVGGEIYGGRLIDENPMPDYPEWVEIEVADVDPTAGRMSVVGPIAGAE